MNKKISNIDYKKLYDLIEPVQTVEDLNRYIVKNFQIELPWDIVDENSTSSSLKFVWDIYNFMLTNEGPARHVLAASRNSAKCLQKDTLVATPNGPVRICELKPGDTVYNENVNEVKVLAVYDQGMQDCIHLMNNRKIWATCTPNHKWLGVDCRRPNNQKMIQMENNHASVRLIRKDYYSKKDQNLSFKTIPAGMQHCYDITVDSPTSLYCLQNGLVTHNTLTSAILQFFSLVHFRRDGLHLSSTIDQSYALISYVDKFLRNPLLADYTDTDNVRNKVLTNLPGNDFTTRSNSKLLVASATKRGTNSQRSSCFDGSVEVGCLIGKKFDFYKLRDIHEKINSGQSIQVLTINEENLQVELKNIKRSIVSEKTERMIIKTDCDYHFLNCTPDHPLAYKQNDKILFKQALEFKIGDSLILATRAAKITSIEFYSELTNKDVYDLTIEDNHNFFANGILVHNCLTFDEVDLTPREILSEAAMIADPALVIRPDGKREYFKTLYVYLSSRKSNDGPIQDKMDEAEKQIHLPKDKRKVKLHKWSSVDWMKKCEQSRHLGLKEEDKTKAYINTDNLHTVWTEEDFALVPAMLKSSYMPRVSYPGCRSCPSWIACQGRALAQRSTSFMLRDPDWLGDVLSATGDAGTIIAQILNWKPETTGIVFKDFSYNKHVFDYIDFYEFVTFGKLYNPKNLPKEELERIYKDGTYKELASVTPTKEIIYDAMVANGWTMCAGVDWGYDPDPAVVSVIGFHKKAFKCAVLHVEAQKGYSNHVWAEYCCLNVFNRFPVEFVAPDQADPSSITYFAKYHVRSLNKKQKPKKIITGVAIIRSLLWNPNTQTSNFAILNDSVGIEGSNVIVDNYGGAQFAINEFQKWTHARDPLGKWKMDKFFDGCNHFLDQLRYVLHPFTRMFNTVVNLKQYDDDSNLNLRMRSGDMSADKKAREINNLKDEYQKHMAEQFGVYDIYKPTSQVLIDQQKEINRRGKLTETASDEIAHTTRTCGIKFSI